MEKSVAIVAGFLVAASNCAAAQAANGEQMYRLFNSWCLGEAPSYDATFAKAKARNLKAPETRTEKIDDGTQLTTHWKVDNNSEAYGISAVRAIRSGSKTDACTIFFPAATIKGAVAYFSEASRFGQPQQRSSDGLSASWIGPFPNSEIKFIAMIRGTLGEGALGITQTEFVH